LGWPAVATVLEAIAAAAHPEKAIEAAGASLEPAGRAGWTRDARGWSRPTKVAWETIELVIATEAIALPLGIPLAMLLFRTDVVGRRVLLIILGLAAFVPLPLHATAWLGALGNAGRVQAFGVQPLLVGKTGAAIVHAFAALPWVILIIGAGLCAVEPELEESALLDFGTGRVLVRVTTPRTIGAIAAAMLAVAVLTAGDMTVTDLLQVRTYAEESYIQYNLGRGPGAAALVALPPLVVLGTCILFLGRVLARLDPARVVSSSARARRWPMGRWRIVAGALLVALVGSVMALPLYSLIWRAGRVGGRATLGQGPTWSLAGLLGTMQSASAEILQPLTASLVWTAVAATVATGLASALAWAARRSILWQLIAAAVLALTLATPGPVAGMSLVLAYRDWPAIYDSPVMIVLAQTLRSLPYSLLLLWPFLRAFPQDYLDTAALEGQTPWRQFLHVVLPMSRRPVAAAWTIAFAIGLGELPATNLAAPPGTQPMSVLIWGLLHTGVESHLSGVALIMLLAVGTAGLLATLAVRSLRSLGE
jgi:iron(III) transport system permease protein